MATCPSKTPLTFFFEVIKEQSDILHPCHGDLIAALQGAIDTRVLLLSGTSNDEAYLREVGAAILTDPLYDLPFPGQTVAVIEQSVAALEQHEVQVPAIVLSVGMQLFRAGKLWHLLAELTKARDQFARAESRLERALGAAHPVIADIQVLIQQVALEQMLLGGVQGADD